MKKLLFILLIIAGSAYAQNPYRADAYGFTKAQNALFYQDTVETSGLLLNGDNFMMHDGRIYYYDGFVPAAGSLMIGNGTYYTNLAMGSANQMLRVNAGGTNLEYFTPSFGTGTVTNVSSGNLGPLFTVNVSNPTTTPAFAYTVISQSANLLYVSPDGSSGSPSFRAMKPADAASVGSETAGKRYFLSNIGGVNNNVWTRVKKADVDDLNDREVLYGGADGSIDQSSNFIFDADEQQLQLNGLDGTAALTLISPSNNGLYLGNLQTFDDSEMGMYEGNGDTPILIYDEDLGRVRVWGNLVNINTDDLLFGIGTTDPTDIFSIAEKFRINASGVITQYNNAAPTNNYALIGNGTTANFQALTYSMITGFGTLTFGSHLTSGGSSYNGGSNVTITSDATNANTASTIVARDGSGNFSAGTITASLTGTASGNELPLIFSAPLSRSVNTISIANAAADGSTKGASAYTANDFDAASGIISLDYTNGQAASGSVKGYLTAADWTTFNGKQSALVSGTNIKTVNGSSLLGAGNLAVGDALVANPLSQFAATTSAQLAGVVSDETGTGAAVFAGSPAFTGTVAMAALSMSGKITSYNGITTANNGAVVSVGTPVHLTGQTAAISATTLYTADADGFYTVNIQLAVTTIFAASTIGCSVKYTNVADNVVKTVPSNGVTGVNQTASTSTANAVNYTVTVYAKSGTAIQYQTAITGTGQAYSLDAFVLKN